MLTPYCHNVLAAELAKPDYDGMAADAAWAWLMEPTPQAPEQQPTGVMLTPRTVAALLGPAKAEAMAAALRQAFPVTADHLMTEGVDPLNVATQGFLGALVAQNVLTAAERDVLVAAGTREVSRPDLPRRFDRRFDPSLWPRVGPDGLAGGEDAPAIHGFPNTITRAEFDAAWAAGRGA